jgi:hypothetical protein
MVELEAGNLDLHILSQVGSIMETTPNMARGTGELVFGKFREAVTMISNISNHTWREPGKEMEGAKAASPQKARPHKRRCPDTDLMDRRKY